MSIEIQGTARAEAAGSAPALNRDILDAMTTLIKQAGSVGQAIAGGFGLAPHDLLAMFKLDGPLPMKELAQRMGCDASFITTIADALEKRGFACREPSQRDRRVKNLVLTGSGVSAKEKLMAQLGTTKDCVVDWHLKGGFKLKGTANPVAISGPIWGTPSTNRSKARRAFGRRSHWRAAKIATTMTPRPASP